MNSAITQPFRFPAHVRCQHVRLWVTTPESGQQGSQRTHAIVRLGPRSMVENSFHNPTRCGYRQYSSAGAESPRVERVASIRARTPKLSTFPQSSTGRRPHDESTATSFEKRLGRMRGEPEALLRQWLQT